MSEARGAEGAGGFLDRLDNDMRRREAKQKVGDAGNLFVAGCVVVSESLTTVVGARELAVCWVSQLSAGTTVCCLEHGMPQDNTTTARCFSLAPNNTSMPLTCGV